MISPALPIRLSGVFAGYGGEPVIEDIGLDVAPGDFIGILGPNGGGKTTLLRVLLGLLPPTCGQVRLWGKPPRAGRHRVGYVPQELAFDRAFPIRVEDVVLMGRLGRRGLGRPYSRDDRIRAERALEALDARDLRRESFGALSGGQRQRVLLARALAAEPELLLLDEPTASVDPRARTTIYEHLKALCDPVAIIIMTHDVGVISAYVKTVGCLNRTLHYHGSHELTPAMVEAAYGCPVDLVAHGVPHRVLATHPTDPSGAHVHG